MITVKQLKKAWDVSKKRACPALFVVQRKVDENETILYSRSRNRRASG